MTAQAARVLACGGEVWVADETTVREYPPLRAGWSRRGEQATVVISGRNAQRVIHGALETGSGDLLALVQPRGRTAEVMAAVAAPGRRRPEVPKLLVWDNAPAHHPKRVAVAAWLAASSWPSCRSAPRSRCRWRTSGAGRRPWPRPTAATPASTRQPPASSMG